MQQAQQGSWTTSPNSVREQSLECSINLPRLGVESKSEEKSKRWVWMLREVPQVPLFYPIKEWNTWTVDHVPLNTIASRTSEFLRLRSIATEYNDDQGSVRCRTMARVEFVINVWQNRETPAFLVHFQRVRGNPFELNRLQAELRSAIFSGEKNPVAVDTGDHPFKDHNVRKTEFSMRDEDMELIDAKSPLELCKRLLGGKQWSERRLGLESLAILTDPTKTIPSASREATNAILFDSDVHTLLQEHLMAPKPGQYFETENYIMALQILAQSLRSLANNHNRANIHQNKKFWSSVLNVFSHNIRHAADRPLEACLSIQCLGALWLNGGRSPAVMAQEDYKDDEDYEHLDYYLKRAHQFGSQHNASLEYETERLLRHLNTPMAR